MNLGVISTQIIDGLEEGEMSRECVERIGLKQKGFWG